MDPRLRGDDEEKADPGCGAGMTKKRKPRWVTAFLRALERTGRVQTAADDAGLDRSTAFARRRAHPDFAAEWAAALERFRAEKARREAEEIEAVRAGGAAIAPPRPVSLDCPSPEGEGVTVQNGQVKRVSGERWGKRKREAFLAELAVSGNFRRASKAAGISCEAVRRRRRKDPQLEAACKAAIEACRARIPEFLAGATAATFDPDALADAATGELPKVTIAEAIKIAQISARAAGGWASPQPEMPSLEDEADAMGPDEIEAVRERLIRKLQRLREREMPRQLAAGWSYDESHDLMVPPGWIKGPDYKPRDPNLPADFYTR